MKCLCKHLVHKKSKKSTAVLCYVKKVVNEISKYFTELIGKPRHTEIQLHFGRLKYAYICVKTIPLQYKYTKTKF